MRPTYDSPSIVLVGLGNIGFRHLQGLARIADRMALIGIDPSLEAQKRSSDEWTRSSGTQMTLANSLNSLPSTCEVAIVATPARDRLQLLRNLLKVTKPRHIVLEKVVFQSLSDFDTAADLCAAAGATVSVNCPRRMWPLYQRLKSDGLGASHDLRLTISWRNLGLACNAVHFIDALQFLANTPDVQLSGARLGSLFPSKREGYYEVYGTLDFAAANGARLTVAVEPDGPEQSTSRMIHGGRTYEFSEGAGHVMVADTGGETLINIGRPPYQSELTGDLVATLLDGKMSPLASLADSKKAHAVLLKTLEPHFCSAGIDINHGLPIT